MDNLGKLASVAIRLDKEHKYESALEAYEKALASTLEFLQDPKNNNKEDKKVAKKYFKMYLERAELIKALLPTLKTNSAVRKRISSSGRGGGVQEMPPSPRKTGGVSWEDQMSEEVDKNAGVGGDVGMGEGEDREGSIALEDYELLESQLKEAEALQRSTLERKQSAEEKVKALEQEMKNIQSSFDTKEMRRLKALEKVVREDFLCPITMEIMVDPVVAFDGYTYERVAITEWYTKQNMSPMTGLPVDSKSLLANHTLKSAIISWKDTMKAEKLVDS
jgi:hypothetical protein